MNWYLEGKLKPKISATYSMDHAADALNDLLTRKIMGKAVLLVSE
jgi:NADPH2:quinone reductase